MFLDLFPRFYEEDLRKDREAQEKNKETQRRNDKKQSMTESPKKTETIKKKIVNFIKTKEFFLRKT